jgi:hypothetical protein
VTYAARCGGRCRGPARGWHDRGVTSTRNRSDAVPADDPAATDGPGGRPLPPAWRDPLLWACVGVALLVYLPHGFSGYLTRDLALYSYAGQQFAEGVPPYLGVVNRAGPLAHAIPGVGAFAARLVGADDMLGMRVLFLLITLAAIAVSYWLARDVFRSRVAGLASVGTLLCIKGVVDYATYGPREKTSMLLFFLVLMLTMAHRRWATTGFFIALTTLTYQPAFLPAIAGTVAAVAVGVPRGLRLRALVRVAVGGLVPTVLVVGSYVAIGELQVFLDDFLIVNALYTEQVSLLEEPGTVAAFMVDGYGLSGLVFLLGLGLVVWLGVRAVRRPATREVVSWPVLVGCLAILAVGVLFALVAFNGFPDAFFLLPPAQLGVGGAALLLVQRRATVGRAVVAGFLALTLVMAAWHSVVNRHDTLEEQRRDVDAVMALLPEDARILAVEAPQPLVLTQQRNLTRWQLFGNGLMGWLDESWPGGPDGYASSVLGREPEVVALGRLDDPDWFTDPLTEDYREVGRSPGWTWYLREDLGEDTLEEAADALG